MQQFRQDLDSDELKRFRRDLAQQEYLFRAHEAGNTMFLVLQGSIGLFDEQHGTSQMIGRVGWGQVLGEQAIVGEPPYHRRFSARALAKSRLLEFRLEDLKIIDRKIPDFSLRILQITAKWLDRTNQLVWVLTPWEITVRLSRAILYIATLQESEMPLTADHLNYLTGLPIESIQPSLERMVREGALTKSGKIYQIRSSEKLQSVLQQSTPSPRKAA